MALGKSYISALRIIAFFALLSATTLFAATKTIAFFTPWSNTNAVLYVDGDSISTMTPLKNYCGWFVANVDAPSSGFNAYFKQTVGLHYVGAEGMTNIEPTSSTQISLDSVAALSDTIWVQGYKNDIPAQFSVYPGVLGDCPLKKFPVTLFDWLHGDKGDGDGSGKNGDPANGVSADFGSGGCRGADQPTGVMLGMVQKELGANGLPVPADPFPKDCKISTHLSSWFLPEVIAKDEAGNEYTNMTCRDLYISMDDEGFWLAEVSKDQISEGNEKHKDGMFPLDDFQYLDEAQTVKNPYYDQFKATKGSGGKHNFGFAMKVQASFEYVPGQYFDFYGDDDVWVFINRKLVVDIGGQHAQKLGAVDLDTLGLIPGQKYDFHIFYVERHTGSSNFRMRTSIDLQVDASMFLTSDKRESATDYNIWQINKKSTFSCGNDNNSTEMDTTGGPSTFKLSGGNLPGPEILDVGTHYEGIKITSDSTFSIDSAAIVSSFALAPGHYFLEVVLKSDPSQSTKIEITIPSYSIPSVAFANADWTILGKEVSGDTVQIGDWAYATYQVHITFLEEWAKVNNYNRKINLSFSDPNIDILDTIGGKNISIVNLDESGHATFYVCANKPVTNASLIAKGAAAGASVWTQLNFKEPPIPQVVNATISDRNGDGRADSLYIHFDRSLLQKSTLDSLQFSFGESFTTTNKFNIVNENDIIVLAENFNPDKCKGNICGFGSLQFTGKTNDIYFGTLNNWFTYQDSGKISHFYKQDEQIKDKVGPIILKANKSKGNDGQQILQLTFSEAISDNSREHFVEIFEYICMRSGTNRVPEAPSYQAGNFNTMMLFYQSATPNATIPNHGDLIRFAPSEKIQDLAGNIPHKDNPWATITGNQELATESPKVITMKEDFYNITSSKESTKPILITNQVQNAQQVGDSLGVQGSLIDYDLSKIMIDETKKEVNNLEAFIESKIKSTATYDTVVTSISEEEAQKQVIADIRTGILDTAYGFSETTIIAINEGFINEANYSVALPPNEIEIFNKLVQNNIEASSNTTITLKSVTGTTQADIFNAIHNGQLDKELENVGVGQAIVDAIKRGEVNEFNIDEYRNGDKSVIASESVEIFYRTRYYSHLGHYISTSARYIKCSDREVYGDEGCLVNKGKIFLAWNMRSDKGRLVGTGVYISRLELKIIVNNKTTMHQTYDQLWGVRRNKTSGIH